MKTTSKKKWKQPQQKNQKWRRPKKNEKNEDDLKKKGKNEDDLFFHIKGNRSKVMKISKN